MKNFFESDGDGHRHSYFLRALRGCNFAAVQDSTQEDRGTTSVSTHTMFLCVDCIRKVSVHLGYGTLQCVVIAHYSIQRDGPH
jgi:hypothetical protein